MPNLHVVVTSIRAQRVGLSIGQWFTQSAKAHGKFDVRLVDLLEVNLPLFNEPRHPRFKQYEHDQTKAWSHLVSSADAFVFVLAEYNFGVPPSFLNAMDYLFHEWAYKPAGIVSYGGVSGGTRSAQMAKQTLTALKVMPMQETVAIPFVDKHLENGVFTSGEGFEKAATVMLDELLRWTNALKVLRG